MFNKKLERLPLLPSLMFAREAAWTTTENVKLGFKCLYQPLLNFPREKSFITFEF